MKLNKMDKTLIEINKIKNIISIDYKDLFYNSQNEKRHIMPGFLVFYDNLKFMYLTVADPYFEEFVRKIRDLYEEEKDATVYEGVLGKQKLFISSYARTLLLNGNLDKTSELYSFYKDKESYDESLLFESDRVKSLFPIIEYHLKETFKLFDKTLLNVKLSDGVNGIYYIKGTIDNAPQLLPLFVSKDDDNTYNVIIGGLFDKSYPIKMNIRFKNDELVINSIIDELHFKDSTNYSWLNERVIKRRDVYLGEKLLVYEEEKINEGINKYDNLLSNNEFDERTKTYLLPWNASITLSSIIEYIDEFGDITKDESPSRLLRKRMTYLTHSDDSFYLKEMLSKRYSVLTDKLIDRKDIIFDYLNKEIIGIKNNGGYVIETNFSGPAKTGFYKTNLDGKYFYHISLSDELDEIDINNLIPLGRLNGLEEKTDLIELKKYLKK